MELEQIILLVINVIGGIAILGSYVLGIRGKPGAADRLWGGVPQKIRPVYYVSMLLSAIGYFFFIYFLLFEVIPDSVVIADSLGYWIFYIIFIGMLGFSALWMPLTNKMANEPKKSTWFWVRTVLVMVGLFSCALYWAILSIQEGNQGTMFCLAAVGSGYFAFHTTVLDMLIWPMLWGKGNLQP
jgi:hypothetical protein